MKNKKDMSIKIIAMLVTAFFTADSISFALPDTLRGTASSESANATNELSQSLYEKPASSDAAAGKAASSSELAPFIEELVSNDPAVLQTAIAKITAYVLKTEDYGELMPLRGQIGNQLMQCLGFEGNENVQEVARVCLEALVEKGVLTNEEIANFGGPGRSASDSITGTNMDDMVKELESQDFDPFKALGALRNCDISVHKKFFSLFVLGALKDENVIREVRMAVLKNYMLWLIENVFAAMRDKDSVAGFENRLWPNELMEYIIKSLAGQETKELLLSVLVKNLPELVTAVVASNIDLCHRYLSDAAFSTGFTAAKRAATVKTIVELEKFIKTCAALPLAEKAKAERAHAVIADIYRHYLNDEAKAAREEAKIRDIDNELYAAYRARLTLSAFVARSKNIRLDPGTKVFTGRSSDAVCVSNAMGSDELYNLMLDPDGGAALSMPCTFSTVKAGEPAAVLAVAGITGATEFVFKFTGASSPAAAKEVVISKSNIEDLFCAKGGKVFADTDDPLYSLKYALFFTGILGKNIDSIGDIIVSKEEKAAAKKDPALLAQIYFEAQPDLALLDLKEFAKGGGIAITCDSSISPFGAGSGLSGAAATSILSALYSISSQKQIAEDPALLSGFARVFMHDLGAGRGFADTTGLLKGINYIRYTAQNGAVAEDAKRFAASKNFLSRLSNYMTVFAPLAGQPAQGALSRRQTAYLLREPAAFKAMQHGKAVHARIAEELKTSDMGSLGNSMWQYAQEAKKVDSEALPDRMEELFRWLLAEKDISFTSKDESGENYLAAFPQLEKPLIYGGSPVGSMAKDSPVLFIATDYGLQEIRDGKTGRMMPRLELALRQVMADADDFKGAQIFYPVIGDKALPVKASEPLPGKAEEPVKNAEPPEKPKIDKSYRKTIVLEQGAEEVKAAIEKMQELKRRGSGPGAGKSASDTAMTVMFADAFAKTLKNYTIGWESLIETVKVLGPDADYAAPALISLLVTPSKSPLSLSQINKVMEALRAVSPSAAAPAAPALIKYLFHPSFEKAARNILAHIGAPAAFELAALLKDKKIDTRQRFSVIKTLGSIGPEAAEAVPELTNILNERTTPADELAITIETLGKIGPAAKDALPALRGLLETKKQYYHYHDISRYLEKAISSIEAPFTESTVVVSTSASDTVPELGSKDITRSRSIAGAVQAAA